MARTYVPTLLSQLRRIERYIERYDETIQENVEAGTINHINTILASIRQILATES